MSLRLKVADVLDACAEHIDAEETAKVSSARVERQTQIDSLADKYATATGEELTELERKKLAESDGDVVGLLRQIVEKQAGHVESLGGPSERDDGKMLPATVKEAADQAYDKFGDWINRE